MSKFSVILCNYNDSRFILNWVEKMSSTYPGEIIIVDDRSTDNSIELIREIQKTRSNVKLVINDGVKGCFGAFVKGCESTESEFVSCWSVDDEPNKGYADRVTRAIEEYPFVNFVSTNCKVIREGDEYERVLFPFDAYVSPDYMVKILRSGYGRMFNLVGMVMRRKFVIHLWHDGGKKMKVNFDGAIAYYMAFDKGFVNLQERLVTYRSYPNSWGASGKIEDIECSTEEAKKLFIRRSDISRMAIESGVWSGKSRWQSIIALRVIMKLPYWIRRIFYKWFYRYDWRIEKL